MSSEKDIPSIDEIIKKISEHSYEYYYPSNYKCNLKKALEKELQYRCNCSDTVKDYSNEATVKRITQYLKNGR